MRGPSRADSDIRGRSASTIATASASGTSDTYGNYGDRERGLDLPPIENYGQLPMLDHLSLSPAADRIALVSTDPGEKQVRVVRTADLGQAAQIGMGLKKLIEVDKVRSVG